MLAASAVVVLPVPLAPSQTASAAAQVPPVNLYIANSSMTEGLEEVPAGGGSVNTFPLSSMLHAPFGVAVDSAENIFVADSFNNRVVEQPAGGGTPVTLPSTADGLGEPTGVAVDSKGDVFMSSTFNSGAVFELPAGSPPDGPLTTVLDEGLSDPAGLALDAAGDLYIADNADNRVLELPAGGGSPVPVGEGFEGPMGVAVDSQGDVFVADTKHSNLTEIPAGGGPQKVLLNGTDLDSPFGVAVDGAGDLFVADTLNNRVLELPASGGGPVTIPGEALFDPLDVAVPPPTAQEISFTSTPPGNAAAGGTYTVTAKGGGSGQRVAFSIDASSTPGACSAFGSEPIRRHRPGRKVPPHKTRSAIRPQRRAD